MSPKKEKPSPLSSKENSSATDTQQQPSFGRANKGLPSHYARIPTRAVFDKKLHPTSRHVLSAIACYANNQGIAWPNSTTIAEIVGISTRQVSTHKTKLKARGYIRELSRYRDRFPSVMGSVWRIIFDERIDDDELIGKWINEDTTGVSIKVKKDGFIRKHTDSPIDEQLVRKGEELARWWAKTVGEQTSQFRIVDDRAKDAAIALLKKGKTPDDIRSVATHLLHDCRLQAKPAPETLAGIGL